MQRAAPDRSTLLIERATPEESDGEPAAPSALAKSSIDGCRPGEKCRRYSRTPAHIQSPPMIRTLPRPGPYPAIATAAAGIGKEVLSWGKDGWNQLQRRQQRQVGELCAGSNDKTAKAMTQH
jgi:hypothetical protein